MRTKRIKLGKPSTKKTGQTWEKFQTRGGLPVDRKFPTFLTGKTVMNGKYPKHSEKKSNNKFFENVDLLRVPKFPRGPQRFGTFPKFDRFFLRLP